MVASFNDVAIDPQRIETDHLTSHDVALVKLPAPVLYSDAIRPICLPKDGVRFDNRENTKLVVTGWGVLHSLFLYLPFYRTFICLTFQVRTRTFP
jgi:hypothetical protein